MGSRNIAISDEAYHMLKSLKRSGESFTDVIERITRKRSVLELVGTLSKSEATKIENAIREIRTRSSRRMTKTAKAVS